ncbi:unnamed protein product [Effrenium voratum]|nr:unnamed protein product [Effrenium voratum]
METRNPAEADGQLPSLWDFVGDGRSSPEEPPQAVLAPASRKPGELQLRFRRKLARTGELSGLAEPCRQLLQSVPEGSAPLGIDALLALALVQHIATAPSVASPSRKAKRSTAWGKTVAPAPSGSLRSGSLRQEAHAGLAAGLAALLQQLPRKVLQGTFELCGCFIQGLCEGQAWSEGALLLQILGNSLELLGFPREHLADFVPQGLLDLWPPE